MLTAAVGAADSSITDRSAILTVGLAAGRAVSSLRRLQDGIPAGDYDASATAAALELLRDAAEAFRWPPTTSPAMRHQVARLVADAAAPGSDPLVALIRLADRLEDDPAAHCDSLLEAFQRISAASLAATASPGCTTGRMGDGWR